MGLLAKSTRGFGKLRVNGLNRVPNPPTRMRAFILILLSLEEISDLKPERERERERESWGQAEL